LNRILVIRGGAIGDFILTLPAIKLLRDRFPDAHLQILGSKHIAALAEERFYANAVRSIESATLAKFFAKDAELPDELTRSFAGFDLVLSYLFDPDGVFETNVKKCGAGMFIGGPSKLNDSEHAAHQLARPLAALGLSLSSPAAQLFPTDLDRVAIKGLVDHSGITIAFHPGSGSESKNWPIENWIELGDALLAKDFRLLIVAGEADTTRTQQLKAAWKGKSARFAENLPLPHLAALLERSVFVGHDSGISHIAAAVGARCLLLFGRTDPAVWAPAGEHVTVLRAPEGRIELIETTEVIYELMRIGIRT
jgi:heptosyltransferase III